MSVRAFQPRSIDPPHFVAEDLNELQEKVGEFVNGEQCDGCGNSVYEIREGKYGQYEAVCAVEDPEGEFAHPAPCGHAYRITIWDEGEVVF